ncbi:MAG: gamma-glutamylcyclotransferase [Marinosulfonomonas sp.]|nr:gamma-glutamylcyclotransferase [Marinosulfonomonas sp.]
MNDPFFFGYGSLVNRNTHDYQQAHPAQISGWRRAWRRSPSRSVSYLTAVPDPGCTIDGLIATVPNADWAALDIRERAYLRHDATDHVSHEINHNPEIAIYAIKHGQHHPPGPENPILLSYLDVVVQGYLVEFGESGVARFFDTTDGWHAPILNDRAKPSYPRAQSLSNAEIALVDHYIRNSSILKL